MKECQPCDEPFQTNIILLAILSCFLLIPTRRRVQHLGDQPCKDKPGRFKWSNDIRGLDARHVPPLYFAKGNYFSVSGRTPFERLIYPMPNEAGLGVHLTIDMGGQAKFGPDVEWIQKIDYSVDPQRAAGFYAAIRAYWPNLPDDALQPAYAGIRPKLSGPGQPAADFLIQGRAAHGMAGLVNLFGIESPGLTASLAIAEKVARMLG